MRLYGIAKSEYLTPELYSINLSPVNEFVYDVVARISFDKSNELEYVKYLFFFINLKREQVTKVRSSFVGSEGYVHIYGNSVAEMLQTRKEELENQSEYFLNEIRNWHNKHCYLEEHRNKLKRTMKK